MSYFFPFKYEIRPSQVLGRFWCCRSHTPELSSSLRILSLTRSSLCWRIWTASSMEQFSRRMLSMASSLSPGSRVPVLQEETIKCASVSETNTEHICGVSQQLSVYLTFCNAKLQRGFSTNKKRYLYFLRDKNKNINAFQNIYIYNFVYKILILY